MTTYIFTVRSEKKMKKERRSFDQEVASPRFGAGATHRVGVRETHVRFIQRNSGRLRYRRGDLAFRAREPRRISSRQAPTGLFVGCQRLSRRRGPAPQ